MTGYSSYLDWYIHVPPVKCDFRSSGISSFKYDLELGEVDLGINYAHGNPEASELLARRYHVRSENVFISSEGASGQNTRIIRCIAERDKEKNEAIVEYPTYEPLLRKTQEHFPHVKRLERRENENYRLDADALAKKASEKTALLALTSPHAPSGALSNKKELEEILTVGQEYGFHVLCDEIYAEFDRRLVPTIFSVDPEVGITTTSFTKAYGLGGLKLGIALAQKDLVDDLYKDVLDTVGNTPNIVQLIALELLSRNGKALERHKQRWIALRNVTEEWLEEMSLDYFPNKIGISYWVDLPIRNTYNWINKETIPHRSLAAVPGAFFLFKRGYRLLESKKVRLGLGNMNSDESQLVEALRVLEKALEP